MEKVKGLTEKQNKLFRYYRLFTIWVISLILGLSIWAIMINNIEWTICCSVRLGNFATDRKL